ncbi:acyltransferase [Winogradskyella sediminis]|uniref:Acetyltransferase (Isoleucine patch superfamily) n=1 Tax=Winogradskyella sediminis TaxID=1382466 RepID=A0A1H1S5J8_9FLAO|nr:hypothetical protein [Winogradskyella sediminis]SDS43360.1 Acetyltransferase (isoleucine patch superfamily) [Winogradskyella sediminis]
MKLFLTFVFGLIPIGILRKILLKSLGHKISFKSKIGINVWFVKTIELDDYASVGYFNFIKLDSLNMETDSFIKNFNLLKGPFTVKLGTKSGISNQNKIRRAASPVSYGTASLQLGYNSFVVSNHFLDLTKSIYIGNNSIIAGIRTQLWTHGYYHSNEGENRIRIDGEINIKDNVYVGSSCIFNPGIKVGSAIHIGAGSVISKDLVEQGMYVSQKLRHIENDLDKIKLKLNKVVDFEVVEDVYIKE